MRKFNPLNITRNVLPRLPTAMKLWKKGGKHVD